ncbi:MAG TPA: histidine phosphatase family protein [Anaerolineales bacterium]|nr:histidine phosphatase family protein [Anaerolineales bacterium]
MSATPKPVYQFVFLRHGESTGNAESRWQGQSDYPLTERGRAQATALARRWKTEGVKFDLAISSTLQRAKETAEIVTSALGVTLEFDEIWLERDIGIWKG